MIGNIIAPLVGGSLVGHTNFRLTSDIMAVSCFTLFLFYLFVGIALRPKDVKPETILEKEPEEA